MSTAENTVILSGLVDLPAEGLRKYDVLGGQVWIGASIQQRVDVPSTQTGELISVFVTGQRLKTTSPEVADAMAKANGKNVRLVGRLKTEDVRNREARDPSSKSYQKEAAWITFIYVDEVEIVD